MNVLFVIDNCHKYCGANVSITIKIAKELKKIGFNVYVVVANSTNNDDDEKLTGFDDVKLINESGKEINYIDGWDRMNKVKKFFKACVHPKMFILFFMKKMATHRIKKSIRKFISYYNIDAVVGIMAPIEIAIQVAQVNCLTKKIIIQYDPYTNNATLPVEEKYIRKRTERQMIDKVDYVLAMRPHYNELVNEFPEFTNRIGVMDLPVISEPDSYEKNKKHDGVYFVYLGTLYSDIRSPEYMLNLFSYLPDEYKLMIAGKGCEDQISTYKSVLGERLIYLGGIPENEARNIMYNADFVINLNNSIKNQIPSKLFEGINTGNPLINICKNVDCPSLEYTRRYTNCVDIFEKDDYEKNAKKISLFVKKNIGKRCTYSEIESSFTNNTIPYAAKTLRKVIIRYD